MPERWLTFAEVQESLGLTADEVRALMEARRLNGRIVDGVVKFDEAEVRRAGGSEKSGEAQFKFLVDEEEERRIEGKAYDGESLAPPKPIERIADDEELIEPEALTEELLRNAELLGGKDIVEFGREVAERSTQEYRHPEISDAGPEKDEEILEPSTVELPEVPFGPLAERISEARREEPAETPAPAAPSESPAPAGQGEVPIPSGRSPVEGYEVEEKEIPEAAAMHVDESVMPAPETPQETYEVEPPPPVAAVTRDIERAVDEETAEVTPAESAPAPAVPSEKPEPIAEKEPAPVEAAAEFRPELEAEPVIVENIPPVETPAEEAVVSRGAACCARDSEENPVAEQIPPAPEAPPCQGEVLRSPEPEPIAAQEVTPVIASKEEVKPEPVEETAEPVKIAPEEAARQVEEIESELSQIATKESLPEAQEDGRIPRSKSGEEKAAEAAEAALAEVSHEEAKPVTDKTKPTPEEQKKKKPDDIEVFDLGEQKPKEEEFELLEEEPKEGAPGGAAPAKEKTLEEEMAELFGDESKEAAPAAAAGAAAAEAPKVEEDFDLSVFQKDKQEAEAAAAPIAEEELFNVAPTNETAPEQSIGEEDVDHQSRIKSVIEERTPASVYLYTAAILLSFIAVGLTGMLLWHAFIMK